MSTRNYIIRASVFEGGSATLVFNKSDEAGNESRLTDPHHVTSADGFTDALKGLIDDVENAEVEFWNDDEEEAQDRFVDGMIASHDDEGLYVRRTIDARGSGWSRVVDPMTTTLDEQMNTWLADQVAVILFDPRVDV